MAVVNGKKTEKVIPYLEAVKPKKRVLTAGRERNAQERVYHPGDVCLENDRRERKASGSYYTPDHIVRYIVENTVGPVLAEKFEKLRPRFREAQRAYRQELARAEGFREQGIMPDDLAKVANSYRGLVGDLFDLKALDPAMGSGHFLVEAVDFICDLRSSCLARNLLVVDEVHASDTYMTEVIRALLDAHTGAGGYALLMSATLGSAAWQRWLSAVRREADQEKLSLEAAIATPYPAVSVRGASGVVVAAAGANDRAKDVRIEPSPTMSDFDQIAQRALAAARAGAKVLVVRNTVNAAFQSHLALETAATDNDLPLLLAAKEVIALHHSRFARGDRRLLDSAVEQRLGKNRSPGGCVVVGTQTLEQSLDIDADLLITDLCPVDVLLQRIGRLHRHDRHNRAPEYATPVCVVLTPADSDLSPLLTGGGQNANGLGPHGYVYRNLHSLEATRRLLHEFPGWRIPEMNRKLVERATHPDALCQITEELGEKWKAHATDTEGGYIADGQVARNHTVRFDKSFFEDNREVCFPEMEDRIRTRLGDDRLEIVSAPPPPSPFEPSRLIDKLELPLRWLTGAEAPESVEPTVAEEGVEFSIGSHRFRYDRLGLRRV